MLNNKPHILLVEDSPMPAKMAAMVLTELNCLVEIAESGEKALEMLNETLYDLIFMDIGLPKMSGVEATQQIKQNEKTKMIPVVALTAHNEEELKEQCFKAGMVGYLVKPLVEEKAQHILEEFVLK